MFDHHRPYVLPKSSLTSSSDLVKIIQELFQCPLNKAFWHNTTWICSNIKHVSTFLHPIQYKTTFGSFQNKMNVCTTLSLHPLRQYPPALFTHLHSFTQNIYDG